MQPNNSANDQIHGSMDVSEQFRTYHTLAIGIRYVCLAIVVSISLLVIAFCTELGWGAGLSVAFVELAIGLYFARERKENSWQSDVASLIVTTEGESGQPMATQARAGIRPGTFAILAISAVLVTITFGAGSALFPHAPRQSAPARAAAQSTSDQTGR